MYLFRRLLKTIKKTKDEIKVTIENRRIFELMDYGVPIWKIAEEARKNNPNINTENLTSYVKVLEDNGFRNMTIYNIIIIEVIEYFKLVYFTIISLFNKDIISMEKYEKVVDEIGSIPSLNFKGNMEYRIMKIKIILEPYVTREDYEIAVNYLNDLKSK